MTEQNDSKQSQNIIVEQYSKIVGACFIQGLSIALFCLPGETTIQCIIGNARKTKISGIKNNEFVVCPFNQRNEVWVIHSEFAFYDLDFSDVDELLAESYVMHDHAPVLPQKNYYEKVVNGALTEIEAGKLSKVVISRQKSIDFNEDFNPVNLFIELRNRHIDSFVCYMMGSELGTWIGASPELLLRLEKKKFFTNALAGTRLEDGNRSVEKFSKKDREEQTIVTSYIKEQLQYLGIETVLQKPSVISAGSIQHILTQIEGSSDLPPWKLLRALHPTPAVCGYPVEQAFKFIQKNELIPRWFYSGFWGPYYSKADAQFYVNLRCLEVRPLKLILFAGAGIVKGSDPGNEFDETNYKMETMLDAIMESM